MNFFSRRLMAVFLLFQTGTAFAANEIVGGLNYRNFDYEEDLRAPLKSSEKSNFFAPFIKANLGLPNLGESFISLSAEYSGNINSTFDGTDLNGVPVKDNNALSFTDIEGLFYWNFSPGFFAQAGLGYHYWNRFLSGGSGYREIYTWYYMPIGILYRQQINPQFRIGVDFTYRLMFQGQIDIIFSETVTNGNDTTLTLGNRNGYKLQFPMQYLFTGTRFSAAVTPWYQYSEIGESDFKYNSTPKSGGGALGYIQEPSSKTQEYGVVLGVAAGF